MGDEFSFTHLIQVVMVFKLDRLSLKIDTLQTIYYFYLCCVVGVMFQYFFALVVYGLFLITLSDCYKKKEKYCSSIEGYETLFYVTLFKRTLSLSLSTSQRNFLRFYYFFVFVKNCFSIFFLNSFVFFFFSFLCGLKLNAHAHTVPYIVLNKIKAHKNYTERMIELFSVCASGSDRMKALNDQPKGLSKFSSIR